MRLLIIIGLLVSSLATADTQIGEFSNPQHQTLYKGLIDELRCLVCQNQTLADSNADLAKDLRRQTHEMVVDNKTKAEIIEYMVARYGDFVLYRPPFKMQTWLLWIGPLVLFVIGLTALLLVVKKNRHRKNKVFSDADYQRASELLNHRDEG